MATDLPRITVVTPSFNQAQFLERTIRSVLEQGYPNLEYFVMDGGSSDGSREIIERYADRIDYWVSQPDGGQAAAINAGWRRASGEIVCWLNSDDYYLPDALALVGAAFKADPALSVLYGSCERVDANGNRLGYLGRPFNRRMLLLSHQLIPQPSAFFARTAVERVGPLDDSLDYSFDYDLLLRLTQGNARIRYVDRPLAGFTKHDQAKTTRSAREAFRETMAVRRHHARGFDRLVIAAQPLASTAFHALPDPLQRLGQRLRTRRLFAEVRRAPRIDS